MRSLKIVALTLPVSLLSAAVLMESTALASEKTANSRLQAEFVSQIQEADGGAERRCAFIGPCGSFTVIGFEGTAAYRLGHRRFIADLESAGEDPNWWLYRSVAHGDGVTTMWALARRPSCGKHTIMRFSNGAWRFYDRTDAWGEGLGEALQRAMAQSEPEPSNSELLEKLRDIESKLKAIQPGSSPSLEDLQNQLPPRS